MNKAQALERLSLFKSLKSGWAYGEGIPIDENVISDSEYVITSTAELSTEGIGVFPGMDGEVIVSFTNNSNIIDFFIYPDNFYKISADELDSLDDFKVEFIDLHSALTQWKLLISSILGLSTLSSMILSQIKQKNLPSRILPTARGSQWSIGIVQFRPQDPFVSMLSAFTHPPFYQIFPTTPLYTNSVTRLSEESNLVPIIERN